MAKKPTKQSAQLKQLTETADKLRARLHKAEAVATKWKAEVKRLEAEAVKRAKQLKKVQKGTAPAAAKPDESWTVLRLRAAAQEAGVAGYSRMTKAALLEALAQRSS